MSQQAVQYYTFNFVNASINTSKGRLSDSILNNLLKQVKIHYDLIQEFVLHIDYSSNMTKLATRYPLMFADTEFNLRYSN